MSANNHFRMTGRLAHKLRVHENRDGSRKVYMTVAVQDDYRDRDGSLVTRFINAEGFIPAEAGGLGLYGRIHKGDLISVSGSIGIDTFEDEETGETVFAQILCVDEVTLC